MIFQLELTVPRGWHELDQDQLRFLLQTIADIQRANADIAFASRDDYAASTTAQVATLCLMRWTGMKVATPYGDGFLMTLGKKEFFTTSEQLSAAAGHLDWVGSIPAFPVRLDTVAGSRAAVAADISTGLTFDAWLAIENYWQMYQTTGDDRWLKKMAELLYATPDIEPDEAERLGIFYWWSAVKDMVSAMFPNLFRPMDPQTAPPTYDQMRRAIDIQMRALTKGDITKERDVLQMDAMRALTELDAQAREYEEINSKFPPQ